MRFAFDDDARAFQAALRDLLARDAPPGGRWAALAELGALGAGVPEELGGLGLDERTTVLLLEEAGRAALDDPLAESLVAAALLADLGGEVAASWLPRIAAGTALLAGPQSAAMVTGAATADLLLLVDGDAVHAVPRAEVAVTAQPSVDPAAGWATVDWKPEPGTFVARAPAAIAAARDRQRLATAALLLGTARQLVAMGTAYACVREQFGVPIGTFQAVKHHLASAHVRAEMAAPLVYRAAWAVATAAPTRTRDVAMARLAAGEAADLAASTALQVHGAIGYTAEHPLHRWLRRAWALAAEHAADPAWCLPPP